MSVLNLFHRGRAKWVCEYVSREAEWYFSELSEFQSLHNTEKLWDPTARKDKSSWDPRDVGGTVMPTWRVGDWCCCGGTVYTHVMLLLWGATSCVGWEWWDRTMKIGSGWYKEIESNGLGFYAEKPSPLDSVSTQRNQVHWTRFLLKKRVHWTCFLCIETEFIGLDFYAEKTESFGLVFCLRFFVREPLSSCRNRALFTRIAKN